jgi:hypothetical protein
MSEKSNDEIRLFIRDEVSGRHLFNAEALQALGIDPANARARGFHIGFQDDVPPNIVT